MGRQTYKTVYGPASGEPKVQKAHPKKGSKMTPDKAKTRKIPKG